MMIVTAWNNGAHHASGAGYGVKISVADRNKYFSKEWAFVLLELEGFSTLVKVNVAKPSFWSSRCRELMNKEIGMWFLDGGLAPWPKGKPPKLTLIPVVDNLFRLTSYLPTSNVH